MRMDMTTVPEESNENEFGRCVDRQGSGPARIVSKPSEAYRNKTYTRKLPNPMPKVIFAQIGGSENKAGDFTVLPM